jgi:EAL and modified HD-GYP domain-containing signal transduction protein
MISATSTTGDATLPPTLTPVYDAQSRWTAMRLNLAADEQLDAGVFASLYKDDESETTRTPLLLDVADPCWFDATFSAALPDARICLVVPVSHDADEDARAALGRLESRGLTLFARGLPDDHNEATPQHVFGGIALDCGSGVSAEMSAALQLSKGTHLARGIETPACYKDCVRAGFQLFEGNWVLHPDATQSPPSSSRNLLLKLLGLVASDADSLQIEAILKRDANLSYQLLKLVNSVSFSLSHKINSFGQAITLLGRRQLQRWLQLLLYAGQNGDGPSGALMGRAAMRAALLEGLMKTQSTKTEDKDRAFMVGMFSLLDVLFKTPMDVLIPPLNLDDSIANALLAREGLLGNLLDVVVSAESTPTASLHQALSALGISTSDFIRAQVQASAWAISVCRDI